MSHHVDFSFQFRHAILYPKYKAYWYCVNAKGKADKLPRYRRDPRGASPGRAGGGGGEACQTTSSRFSIPRGLGGCCVLSSGQCSRRRPSIAKPTDGSHDTPDRPARARGAVPPAASVFGRRRGFTIPEGTQQHAFRTRKSGGGPSGARRGWGGQARPRRRRRDCRERCGRAAAERNLDHRCGHLGLDSLEHGPAPGPAVDGRDLERRLAAGRASVHVCPSREERLGHVCGAGPRCETERSPAVAAGRVDASAGPQQQLDHPRIPLSDREGERRPALPRAPPRRLCEQLHHRVQASRDGPLERGAPPAVERSDVGAVLDQQPD
mmetsp:Transcript_26900/g.87526  ORF Transcript_26900/g.87526 Transcript_26900/m.87526 type:complete len:323 (+) Transcript_26900:167-1135(+)